MDVRSRVLVWRTGVLLRRENHPPPCGCCGASWRRTRPPSCWTSRPSIERYPLGQTHELRSMLGRSGSSGLVAALARRLNA